MDKAIQSVGGTVMEKEAERKSTGSVERVIEVARQQKRLIWLILIELILGILFLFIAPLPAALWLVLSVIMGIVCAYFVYKVGRALEMSTLWLVIAIVLLFLPYISIVPLLYVNGKATRFLSAAGVKVGLMGAKRKSMGRIYELE